PALRIAAGAADQAALREHDLAAAVRAQQARRDLRERQGRARRDVALAPRRGAPAATAAGAPVGRRSQRERLLLRGRPGRGGLRLAVFEEAQLQPAENI